MARPIQPNQTHRAPDVAPWDTDCAWWLPALAMVVYAAIAVVLFFATFAMTKERVHPPKEQTSSLKTDVRDLFRNTPWVVLCVVGISALTYANIRGTVIIYYFDYVVPGGKEYFSSVMTTGAMAFIAGVMVTSPLSKRFGKRNFYMVSMALTAILTAAFYYVPPTNIALVWGAHALISFVAAPTAPLVWAMYADTADYSEWKWGRRATGLIFSAASFAQKFGWALGGGGTGWLLAYFGYVPNVAQSAGTIDGIMMMMSFIPAAGAVIAIVALWYYKLDEATVAQMGRELKERRARDPDSQGQSAASQLQLQPFVPPLPPKLLEFILSTDESAPGTRRPAASTPRESGWNGPGSGAAASGQSATAVLSPGERAALADEFQALLRAGVHGLCFSPYGQGQAPGTQIGEAQIRARLEIIRPHTRWIRTFSCTEGHQQTPRIAHELGLKTMVGAWLGRDRAINEREIDNLIAVARAGHADIVAVGNEVMLREDMSEDELLGYIGRVRAALPGAVIGYVDAYFLFEKHPRITAACDVVLTNCYPFWEGCPREHALAYMQTMLQRARAAAPGKRIIISETGWPDQGSAFRGSVPSVEATIRYFVDTMNWVQRENIEVFWFSAFDEPWKVGAEGDVGAYWGLWDKDGKAKFS